MRAVGLSQSELARRIGTRQSTINGMIRRNVRSSPYLLQIARELRTTPEYLTGEINDPSPEAEPPPARTSFRVLSMPVAVPTEPVLARMFEELLETVELKSRTEVAAALAAKLPASLGRLQRQILREFETGE